MVKWQNFRHFFLKKAVFSILFYINTKIYSGEVNELLIWKLEVSRMPKMPNMMLIEYFFMFLFHFENSRLYENRGWSRDFFGRKKKIASAILEKSKIPSIQVVTNIILHNLYRRNFWFFSNWRRYFFFTNNFWLFFCIFYRKGWFYAKIALYVIGYETTTAHFETTNEPILESRDIGLQHDVTEKTIWD